MPFEITDAHQAIFDAVKNKTGNMQIEAVAGSGKTSSIVEAAKLIPRGEKSLFIAFSKSIQLELAKRLPRTVKAKTLNGLGQAVWGQFLRDHGIGKFVDIDNNKLYRLWREMGKQGVYPWSHTKATGAVLKLAKLAKANGIVPDDDPRRGLLPDAYETWQKLIVYYNVALPKVLDRLTNAEAIEEIVIEHTRTLLLASLEELTRIDFDDQLWLPFVFGAESMQYDRLFVDECQDMSPLNHELVSRSLAPGGQLIAVGDSNQCHPPGVLVSMTGGGQKRIEDVIPGDFVVGYHDCFRGIRTQGRRVEEVAVRHYTGPVLHVEANHTICRMTPEHRVPTRMFREDGHALYLMKSQGGTYRIGSCQLRYTSGFGPSVRARQENAECLWVLDVFEDEKDARIAETVVSTTFGLPERIFFEKGHYKSELLHALGDNSEKAARCLDSFGRSMEHPLWSREHNPHIGKKIYIARACNLIEGWNEMRSFEGTRDGGSWSTVSIRKTWYTGQIYSLKVVPSEKGLRLYVADGLVVHNSIFGFRGADAASMATLAKRFDSVHYPLHVTYRCPRAVVALAQALVPHIRARDGAEEGIVELEPVDGRQAISTGKVAPGDFVLSRTNAPAIALAQALMKARIPVEVIGRDLAGELQQLVQGLGYDGSGKHVLGLADFLENVDEWETQAVARANEVNLPETTIASLRDKAETLRVLSENAATVPQVKDTITALFQKPVGPAVRVSSVHRAKGLEADRVWILNPEDMPHPKASQGWELLQEANLLYVAISRSARELRYLTWE